MFSKIKLLVIFLISIQLYCFSQSDNLGFIKKDNLGVQSSLLFENDGSDFSISPYKIEIEQTENGIIYPKLTVSGDFDGDGLMETALFYDYLYHPNSIVGFTCSKIVIYKSISHQLTPVGIWFSTKKNELDFSKITFSSCGDYNNDGKADIAMLYNHPDSTSQNIYVIESLGTNFSELKTYYKTERDQFNFYRVRSITTGDYNHDGKADLAAFYNYARTNNSTKQTVFDFESTGNTFSTFKPLYSTTKETLDFLNLKFVVAADFNGDGFSDIACIEDIPGVLNQRILVLENNIAGSLTSKDYITIDRNTLNFDNIKFVASGRFSSDDLWDLALCYDNVINSTQTIYILRSNQNTFLSFQDYYSKPTSELSFENILSVNISTTNINTKVSATLWKNNKKGAVTFGFDDGFVNALRYGGNYLAQQQIHGTFYDITNVAFNNEPDYANWDTLSYYKNQGHEICSHTANHKGIGTYTGADSIILLDNLLLKSKQDLDNKLQQNTLSLSYPFGNFNYQSLSEVSKYFLNGRTSQDGFNLATPFDFIALKSKYVDSQTTPTQIDAWLSEAEYYKYHLSLMFHNLSVVPFDKTTDSYVYAFDDFKQSVNLAKQRNLWIDTQANIYKYIKERNGLKITKYETYADSIVVNITSELNSSIFDQELTLKIELPSTWNVDSVAVNNNLKTSKTAVFNENNKKYSFVNAVPDNRKITIFRNKKYISEINDLIIKPQLCISTFKDKANTYIKIKGDLDKAKFLVGYTIYGQKIFTTSDIMSDILIDNNSLQFNQIVFFVLFDKYGNKLAVNKSL